MNLSHANSTITSAASHFGFKSGGELIIPETSFYQILFKDSPKASEITLNLKLTNKNIANRSRIVNFEDTRGRWIDISMSQVVGLPKEASRTLDLSTCLQDVEIFPSFLIMKL